MTIRVKMMITLDIDTEEYTVPADGKVNTEIEEFVREAFYDLEISSGSAHPVVTRILEGKVQLSKNVTSGSF